MKHQGSRNLLQEFSGVTPTLPEPFRLWFRDSCISTSDEAHALGAAGAPAGAIVISDQQTAGRGRRGNPWFGNPGESLTFSILWKPDMEKPLWPRLAIAAGLAVAEACEAHVPFAAIKWPNDVWISNRKVAGILVEAGDDFAVVGIGININIREFPENIRQLATSLMLESGNTISRSEVFSKMVSRFAVHANRLQIDFEDILKRVRQRCVLSGNPVELTCSSGRIHGICEGIGSSGELLVRTPNGLKSILQADEVRPVFTSPSKGRKDHPEEQLHHGMSESIKPRA